MLITVDILTEIGMIIDLVQTVLLTMIATMVSILWMRRDRD